jgi:hypothetical protein
VEDPAHDVGAFEIASELGEMIDLVAGQSAVQEPVEEDTRLFDCGVEGGGAGLESFLDALSGEIEVEAIDLASGFGTQAFLGAAGVLAIASIRRGIGSKGMIRSTPDSRP